MRLSVGCTAPMGESPPSRPGAVTIMTREPLQAPSPVVRPPGTSSDKLPCTPQQFSLGHVLITRLWVLSTVWMVEYRMQAFYFMMSSATASKQVKWGVRTDPRCSGHGPLHGDSERSLELTHMFSR